jgi:hypothetical protein
MGRASGHTAKWCSISSLGPPERSDGSHANTSEFSRRKLMSVLSYLGERPASMVIVREVPSCQGTLLVRLASPMSLPLRGAGLTPLHTMAEGPGEGRLFEENGS